MVARSALELVEPRPNCVTDVFFLGTPQHWTNLAEQESPLQELLRRKRKLIVYHVIWAVRHDHIVYLPQIPHDVVHCRPSRRFVLQEIILHLQLDFTATIRDEFGQPDANGVGLANAQPEELRQMAIIGVHGRFVDKSAARFFVKELAPRIPVFSADIDDVL